METFRNLKVVERSSSVRNKTNFVSFPEPGECSYLLLKGLCNQAYFPVYGQVSQVTFFVELALKVTWNFLLSFSVRRGVKNKNECAALFFSSTSARQFLLNYIQCFVSKHYEFILLSVIFFKQQTEKESCCSCGQAPATHRGSPGSDQKSVDVGFVVNKVALGQVPFRVLRLSLASTILPILAQQVTASFNNERRNNQ